MYRLIILAFCIIAIGCQSTARFRAQRNQTPTKSESYKTSNLESFVNKWLGVPYKYGGTTRSGIDCSGFTSQVYKNCYSITIPRVSSDQYKNGNRISDRNLRPGDLVFFSNVRYGKIDHVGVYMGDKRFAHATESSGVTISLLSEEYYQKRYAGACRY